MLTFEWDEAKNVGNIRKHGVSFEEATEIFLDPLSLTISDDRHSAKEERFVTIGATTVGLLVVVVHTDREGRVRIISARNATSQERKYYE